MVELPTLTRNDEVFPRYMVLIPVGSAAGMVATSGWLVTTDGWVVTTVSDELTPAGSEGWPVTTPREFVWLVN